MKSNRIKTFFKASCSALPLYFIYFLIRTTAENFFKNFTENYIFSYSRQFFLRQNRPFVLFCGKIVEIRSKIGFFIGKITLAKNIVF